MRSITMEITTNKTDKKDHILDTAERMFSDIGYDAASTRMISGEAGVNMAMLNYYFGSKEGLYLAVFERKISAFRTLIRSIGDDDSISAWDKLERCIDNYVEKIVTNNCFQKLINRELARNTPTVLSGRMTEILMMNVLEFRKIIKEGIESGMFHPDADADFTVMTIFGTKNYIINSPQIASQMLGFDTLNDQDLETKLKPRIKVYLKKLLKSYLVKQ